MADPRELGDPGRESFRLDQYPFYQLNRVASRYNAVIGAELRRIGIDIPTWRVLMILGEHAPRGLAEIAQAAVINKSTMTRIVQRMTRDGLTRCASPADDGRVTEVWLTRHGEEKLAQARTVAAPVYAKVIRGFSQREFEQLIASLERLHDNLRPASRKRRPPEV